MEGGKSSLMRGVALEGWPLSLYTYPLAKFRFPRVISVPSIPKFLRFPSSTQIPVPHDNLFPLTPLAPSFYLILSFHLVHTFPSVHKVPCFHSTNLAYPQAPTPRFHCAPLSQRAPCVPQTQLVSYSSLSTLDFIPGSTFLDLKDFDKGINIAIDYDTTVALSAR